MIHIPVLFLFAWLSVLISAKPYLHKADNTPKLTLPWGTWEGKPYGDEGETILFKNVRYGKAPVEELRFAAPQYPDPIKDKNQVQDDSFGPSCIQAEPKAEISLEPTEVKTQDEDCLFLDVYVPSWAFEEGAETLPVVVWIYGGAYFFGSKDVQLPQPDGSFSAYDGQGIRDATTNSVIWVTANYRLGAYGFLGGQTIEEKAQPNAGLHDQRLFLDWVQKYIGQVKGDKEAVSVWGLSAGAGSILHHLTAYGGAKNEEQLFQRAAMWSTAFQWSYDRRGSLEQTFIDFAEKAKCPRDAASALDCLRKADNKILAEANQAVVSKGIGLGMFPFGPAVDGDLVPELPAVLLKKGKHVQCDSIALSHDFDEVSMFLAKWVDTKEDFTKFVGMAFPGAALDGVRQKIEDQYPPVRYDFNQTLRMRGVLRDSTFICNKRQVYNAFRNMSRVYTARFEVPPAQHGLDLLAITWHHSLDMGFLIKRIVPWLGKDFVEFLANIWSVVSRPYQRYFASLAMYGDPNMLNSGRSLNWETTVDDGNELTNSLKIGVLYTNPLHPFYTLGEEKQSSSENCDFWDQIAQEISDSQAQSTACLQTQGTRRRPSYEL